MSPPPQKPDFFHTKLKSDCFFYGYEKSVIFLSWQKFSLKTAELFCHLSGPLILSYKIWQQIFV